MSHISRDRGAVTEIRCKLCLTPIQGLVEHDHPDLTKTRKMADGTILRQTHLVLRPNAMYDEMTLLMDDGSRHVTHICKQCKAKNLPLEVITRLMQMDIDELRLEGLFPDTHELWHSRTVVGVEA